MDYTQLQSALAANIHAKTIAERDYKKAQAKADKWEKYYHLALKEGRKDLIQEAKFRKDIYAETASNLKALLDEQSERLATLRRNLNTQGNTLPDKFITSNCLNSIEEKLQQLEACSQVMAEPPSKDLITRLYKVESELKAMKAQLLHQQAGISTLLQQNSTVLENVRNLLAEASFDTTSELTSTDIKTQLVSLSNSNVEAEFVCYSPTSQNQEQSPTADTVNQIFDTDAELENLRSQLDKL